MKILRDGQIHDHYIPPTFHGGGRGVGGGHIKGIKNKTKQKTRFQTLFITVVCFLGEQIFSNYLGEQIFSN